ncbi:MAG: hypothetical protein HN742_26535 [Lentisphaerae bacterium]|nr:hypothetical protein [Lentisphaerota bacterium]MBT4820244.1 hypothetical protein [Lentisphaerota bacterium]MBT5606021.1 hypothetical protein [Lentisphaerota bacterium]MBT7058590.1 hypothetical protein [Lentisphaerota bacterium]MBT7845460.1 hypothetical protein [Lentisphaerota bacterium]
MNSNNSTQSPSACAICGVSLRPVREEGIPLCEGQQCQWRYALLQKQLKVCTVCGRPLSDRELSSQTCQEPACQRSTMADLSRRMQERDETRNAALLKQEVEQATQLRKRVLKALGVGSPESLPLVVVRANTGKAADLSEERVRALRDYLTPLVDQAAESISGTPPPQETAPDPTGEIDPVAEQTCACCRGFCCRNGGNHAYLTVETLQSFMAARPSQCPNDVLDAYLTQASGKAYRDSCIFHRPDGCGLSRAMRSNTCNDYFCRPLQRYREDTVGGESPGAFIVAADGGEAQAAVVVRAPPLPGAAAPSATKPGAQPCAMMEHISEAGRPWDVDVEVMWTSGGKPSQTWGPPRPPVDTSPAVPQTVSIWPPPRENTT